MLTIKNHSKINNYTFHFHGVEWIVYRMEEQTQQYGICLMPRGEDGSMWDISKVEFVYLSRMAFIKDCYHIQNGRGKSYITKIELNDTFKLIESVCRENLLPHIVYNYQNVPF